MNLYIEVNDSSQLDHWNMLARRYNRRAGKGEYTTPSPVFIPTVSYSGNPILKVDMMSKFYINKSNNSVNISVDSKFIRGRPTYKLMEFLIADLRTLVRLYISHGA